MTHPFDPSSLTAGTAQVLREITLLAARGKSFSSDDVRARLDAQGVRVDSDDVGNAVRFAVHDAQLIERVGETHSVRPEAHRRRIGVYRLRGSKDATPSPQTEARQTVLVE